MLLLVVPPTCPAALEGFTGCLPPFTFVSAWLSQSTLLKLDFWLSGCFQGYSLGAQSFGIWAQWKFETVRDV